MPPAVVPLSRLVLGCSAAHSRHKAGMPPVMCASLRAKCQKRAAVALPVPPTPAWQRLTWAVPLLLKHAPKRRFLMG